MSDQSALIELLKPFVDAWSQRDERTAAKEAGKLTFWRSGMLKQLEAIAAGTATPETFVELRRNFDDTAERVNHSMIKLKEMVTAQVVLDSSRKAQGFGEV
jgi:hypothetical protein